MTRLFLSGPMRGHRHFNFEAFDAAAFQLERAGYRVWSPARRDRWTGFDAIALDLHGNHDELAAHQFDLREAMSDCLRTVCRWADGVALLPGWEQSAGARAEWHTAQALDIPCRTVDEWADTDEVDR
jgi:hypothetical protein